MIAAAVDELKTRARLRLNAARREGRNAPSLREWLSVVAREAGFADWDHARRILSGGARAGEDMGTFWYSPRCATLLNEWFAREADARNALARHARAFLLPYARQFIVVQQDFVRELGMEADDPAWDELGRDLVRAYGSPAWARLCSRRLQATRGDASPR